MKKRTRHFLAVAIFFALIGTILFSVTASADSSELYTFQIKGSFETTSARQMLDDINDLRANDAWYWNSSDTEKITVSGLQSLVYDYGLEQAAMQRAAELAVYYNHTRPNGKSPLTTYSEAFFTGTGGENIACADSSFSANDIFIAWAEEDEPYEGQGHRRNMLNSSFRAVGIGCFECDGMKFWAQEFSSTISGAPAAPLTAPVTVEVLQDRIESVSLGRSSFSMKPDSSIDLDQISFTLHTRYAPWASVPCVTPVEAFSVADPSIAKIKGSALVAQSLGETTLSATVSGMTVTAPLVVQDNNSLSLNNPIEVTLMAGEEQEFGFVPSETGTYVFYSTGNYDTIAFLYDSDHNMILLDDNNGENGNFSLASYLTAGTQYYYGVQKYGSNTPETFVVNLIQQEIVQEDGFSGIVLSDGTVRINECYLTGDIIIPEQIAGRTVSSLESQLFFGNDNITSVSIPKTVTYFGSNRNDNLWDYVFSYCYNLQNIYVDSANPTFKSIDGVLFTKDGSTLINYPCAHPGSVYHVSADWLCCTSFAYCSNLKFLFLDNPNTYWYTYTFAYTGQMTTFYEPGAGTEQKVQTEISNGREYSSDTEYCKLKSSNEIQQLPSAVREIQREAFQDIAVQYLRIPDTCRSIGSGAFTGSGLEYVSVPASTTITSGAFDSSVIIEKR